MINYDNKIFHSVDNSPNGEVSKLTTFHYYQKGDLVWGSYSGGHIKFGTLIASVDAEGVLDMRYQHINLDGEFKLGKCRSLPKILPDGRLQLEEHWQWLTGDQSSGFSIIEEIAH